LIEPFMPAPSRLGRPRATELRAAGNAILYMASTDYQQRATRSAWKLRWRESAPSDGPPRASCCRGSAQETCGLRSCE
jgi:hypothetical protein